MNYKFSALILKNYLQFKIILYKANVVLFRLGVYVY